MDPLLQPLLYGEATMHEQEKDENDTEPPRGLFNNCCPITSLISTYRRERLLHPLLWPVSKEDIHCLQSGNARRMGDTISVYQHHAWHPLPIGPLNPSVGTGAISDGHNHYNVLYLTMVDSSNSQSQINCSVYSTRTKLWWSNRKPIYIPRIFKIYMENPVICGNTVYLATTERGLRSILSLDIRNQSSNHISLPPAVDYSCELTIAKCGEDEPLLCIISYCRSTNIFSVWLHHESGSNNCSSTSILSVPLREYRNHWEEKWLKIHQVKCSFDWPGPVECFALLNDNNLLVMAMKDGNVYTYNFDRRRFAKLDESWTP